MSRSEDPFSKALGYAYRLLAIRGRTEREIEKRLKEKAYDRECTSAVVGYLKEKGFIDDAQFVREWIKDRSQFNPKGALAIRDELIKKGVDEGLIDTIVKEKETGYNEYELARTLADKRREALKDLSKIKRKKSIYNYLARRGFSFDIINDIIDKI